MADPTESGEIVVRFDYSGDSLVLSEAADDEHDPGVFAGEARVEVDPLVEAFARSPYDPVIGAMMMGRATGEVIVRPPGGAWMRPLAYLLAIGMVGQFATWIYYIFQSGDRMFIGSSLASFAFSVAIGVGGLLLLVRLLRGSGEVIG
jgi:hypothetical protein